MFATRTPDLSAEAAALFGARAFGSDEARLVLHCAKASVPDLADWLIGRGAIHVAVAALDYVFAAQNPLFDKLVAGLG